LDTHTTNEEAQRVVAHMLEHDRFSQWLGIQLLDIKEGYCKIQMQLREEMVNGFGIIHGGILFSLADSAFAFACNNRNNLSVALDVSITFTKPAQPGDTVTAEAKELHHGKQTGLYLITLTNQHHQQLALFKGTCFRTGKSVRNTEQRTRNSE
jgi:acyl-CoA thioesterase